MGKIGPIDWNAIRSRMEGLTASLGRPKTSGAEAARTILKERAVLLAKKPDEARPAAEFLDLLAFQLSGEKYGLDPRLVNEVCGLIQLTPLPGLPDFVLGIMNLRGRIVSVIDLGKLFGLPERGLTDTDRVIIVGDGTMEFGLLANGVSGILTIPFAAIQESPPTLTGIRRDLLLGVTPDGVAVLDLSRMLSDERVLVGDSRQEVES
ncbi:MAG TPA: chemotaxis protein CheW [Spirochaetia bacterium]|nr:chemotaxis protein CheW [Spirochaetia bacterium]